MCGFFRHARRIALYVQIPLEEYSLIQVHIYPLVIKWNVA